MAAGRCLVILVYFVKRVIIYSSTDCNIFNRYQQYEKKIGVKFLSRIRKKITVSYEKSEPTNTKITVFITSDVHRKNRITPASRAGQSGMQCQTSTD